MNLISYLRSRPMHERRILAIAAYTAIAAVVVAVWVVSFRNNLARIPDVGEPTTVAPAGEPPSPAAHSLRTPFQSLSETWRQTIEQLKTGLAAGERLGRGEEKPGKTDAPEALNTEEGITVRVLAGEDAALLGAPPAGRPLVNETPKPVTEIQKNPPTHEPIADGHITAGQPNAPTVAENLAQIANATPPGGELQAEALPREGTPAGERPGFFAALEGVLAAIVRSFAGLTR